MPKGVGYKGRKGKKRKAAPKKRKKRRSSISRHTSGMLKR